MNKTINLENCHETRLLNQYVDSGLLINIAKAASSKATEQISDLTEHALEASKQIIATFPTHDERKECLTLSERKVLHMWDLNNDERTACFFTPTSSKGCFTVDYQLFVSCSSAPISSDGYDPEAIAKSGAPCGEGIHLYQPDQDFSFAWANDTLTLQ